MRWPPCRGLCNPGGIVPSDIQQIVLTNLEYLYLSVPSCAGERDADRCIELRPEFAKGYSRKAHVQFFMKEYEKAIETYERGLTFDPANQELKDGVQRCRQSINKFMMGTASEDEIIDAMKLTWARMKIVMEPSCAVPLATILKNPEVFKGRRVGVVITGGNVDLAKLPWMAA